MQQGNLQPDQIDEEMLNQHVCMHELAPVDLVIRTGGGIALVTFCFGKLPMPNFTLQMFSGPIFDEQDFEGALNAFANGERRFGGTSTVMKQPDGGRFC